MAKARIVVVFAVLSSVLFTPTLLLGITFQPEVYALNQPTTDPTIPTIEEATPSWEQFFGGSGTEVAWDLIEASTGGYVIAGTSNSFDGEDIDAYVIRTDDSDPATEQWYQTYGGSYWDEAYAITECNDGGFAFVGFTDTLAPGGPQVYWVRTDSSGNELFSQTYGGNDGDYGYDVVALVDGGFVIVGVTMSYGNNPGEKTDIWLLRIAADGTLLWEHTYGNQEMDYGFRLITASTGGFAILGWITDISTMELLTSILRVNENGDIQWFKNFTITEGVQIMGQKPDFIETLDGGFAITGSYQEIPPQAFATYLLKTDASGNEQWRQFYNDMGALSLVQRSDGGYTLLGAIMENNIASAYMWGTDSLGNFLWGQNYGEELIYDVGTTLITPQAGGYTFVGVKDITENPAIPDYDVWLVRIPSEGPRIPGFPLASILVGVIIALSFVFYIRRKRRLQ